MLHHGLCLVCQILQLEYHQQCWIHFGIPIKSLPIFWNISFIAATQKGNHMYLYLPNQQKIVVEYNKCLSNFRLWLTELASVSVRYLTPASLGKILFHTGPLCMGLNCAYSALLSLSGFTHSYTLPLAFWDQDKAVAPLWCLIHTQGHYDALLSKWVIKRANSCKNIMKLLVNSLYK